MDVERTMQFILEHQAKAEADMAAMREATAADKAEWKAQMAAILGVMADLTQVQVEQGRQLVELEKTCRRLGENHLRLEENHLRMEENHLRMEESQLRMEESQLRMDDALSRLAKAQEVTEVKLQGFIDALRRGGNGA